MRFLKKITAITLVVAMIMSVMSIGVFAAATKVTLTLTPSAAASSGGGGGIFIPTVPTLPSVDTDEGDIPLIEHFSKAVITDFTYDESGKVSISVDYVPDEAIVYVAANDENGKLLELKELSLYNGTANTTFSAENVFEYKAYVWKDMKPLCEDRAAAQVTSVNESLSILLSDIISFNGSRLKFYRGDSQDYVDLADDGAIVFSYNGYIVGKYASPGSLKAVFEEYFDVDSDDYMYGGIVKLISDDTGRSGYTTVALEIPVTAVVDQIKGDTVRFKEAVRTTDGKTISRLYFDPEDTEVSVKLTKNGEDIDYTQLTEGDVLSVYANSVNEKYFAEVIDSGKITGMVEERTKSYASADDYSYKINGKWYDVANNAYGAGALKPGAEGTFYIDKYGKIVAYKDLSKEATADNYAYIMNAAITVDEWGKNSIRVQWLDKTGEICDTYLDSTVTIENIDSDLMEALDGEDGVTFTKEYINDIICYNARIKMETFANGWGTGIDDLREELVNKFVTYSLSGDTIKTITFPMNVGEEEIDLVNLVAVGYAEYDEIDREIKISTRRYDVGDDTLVFYVDAEDGIVVDGEIPSKNVSGVAGIEALATGRYDYVEAYDFDNQDILKVIVVYDVAYERQEEEEEQSPAKYGYIMNSSMASDEWGNNGIAAQILDESGEFISKYIAPKLTLKNIDEDLKSVLEGENGVTICNEEVNGISYYSATINMGAFTTDWNAGIEGLCYGLINRFVTYSLSGDRIRTITFPMNTSEYVEFVNMNASGEAEYDKGNKKLTIDAAEYTVGEDVAVFYVSSEDGCIADGEIPSKNVSGVAVADMLAAGEYSYVEAYDVSGHTPTVLVVYDVDYEGPEEEQTPAKYGYIMNAAVTVDEWGNYNIRAQLLDESNEIYDTYLASTVTIQNIYPELKEALDGEDGVTIYYEETNDIGYYNARIKMETFAAYGNPAVDDLKDSLVNRFVTYSLSGDTIKTITFPMNEADEDVDLVNLVAAGAAEYDEIDREIKIGARKYDVGDDTLVFYVAAEDENVADGAIPSKRLSKVTSIDKLVTGNDYPRIDAYDLIDGEIPKVLVVYDRTSMVSPVSNIAVIESVGYAVVDGEHVTSITYWKNGEKATAYSDPNADAWGDLDITEARQGDIWKLVVEDGTVTAARRIAEYYRDYDMPDERGMAEFIAGALQGEDVVFGPVVDYKSTNNRIVVAEGNNFYYEYVIRARDANVYIVENVRGKLKVSVGAAMDVEYDEDLIDAAKSDNIQIVDRASGKVIVGAGGDPLGMMDYVFAVEYDDEVQDVVVYKPGSFDKWYVESIGVDDAE